ncbi:MAG: hypothetical protein ABII80_02535 [bacterium]
MSKLAELQKDLRETYIVGNGRGECAFFKKRGCKVDNELCIYPQVNPDETVDQPHKKCFTEPIIPETYYAALIQWANQQ